MEIYIRDIEAISIQNPIIDIQTWEPINYDEPYVRCIEPAYSNYIPPMSLRRMSHVIKRSIVSALCCIENSGVKEPDAILVGTGLGCVEDTEKFLQSMIENKEQFLQPTSFIQSTHNTISSQIAIRLQNHNFNNTHVHKSISFESALHEAYSLMLLDEINTAMVGGSDETTPNMFKLLNKLGYIDPNFSGSLHNNNHGAKGTFLGEGSVSVMLTNQYSDKCIAKIDNVEIGYRLNGLKDTILDFLNRSKISIKDIDTIMTGRNGDFKHDEVYDQLSLQFNCKESFYKNLCGEYYTAAAYGMYVACKCLQKGYMPSVMVKDNIELKNIHHILLFQYSDNKEYSLILLSKCGN